MIRHNDIGDGHDSNEDFDDNDECEGGIERMNIYNSGARHR